MNRDDPQEQMLENALAAYKSAVSQGHRTGMIAALTAADLYAPEWLEDALRAYHEEIPGASTHRIRLTAALAAAQALCEAAGRQGELARGMPVTYGAPPVIRAHAVAPVVSLWPDGMISAGGAMLDRAGAQELVRLLQLALRDQAALLADSV